MKEETMFKAGLVGITGYTGMELARLLEGHPQISLHMATSRQEQGKLLKDLYPFLQGFPSGYLVVTDFDAEKIVEQCHVVFLAVPHGVAMESAGRILTIAKKINKIVKVVDLSADFRLKDASTFEEWYNTTHTETGYLKEAVYGLLELYEPNIKKSTLVANPGCYPTASILSLYPALKHNLVELDDIVIDAKSGTTGAGRKAQLGSLYCEVSDSFKPYGLAKHRHIPEIEQELSSIAHRNMQVSFNPHLLPIQRGILVTIYTKLLKPYTQEEVQEIYEKTWADAPFVRVLPSGRLPETRNVRGSLFCDVAVTVDSRINRLIITGAIDNLCRGASGQALANANLMLGLDLAVGLKASPIVP